MYPKLEDYAVSPETGFLTFPSDCDLPKCFEPWRALAGNITVLIEQKQLRLQVDNLPLIDHAQLQTYRHHCVAHLFLSAISCGYVWQDGEENPVKILPKQLAVPWYAVSEYLGVKPIMSHISQCLNNCTLIDEHGPWDPENMTTQIQHCGGQDYVWFCVVTGFVELAAAPGIKACIAGLNATLEDKSDQVYKNLTEITASIANMKIALARMHEQCSSSVFFNTIRQFLAGWGTDGSPLPDGLIYEGVSEKPKTYNGGSAAQSSTFQTFDVALGIEHEPRRVAFLQSMRDYMPRKHRDFIEHIATQPSFKDYIQGPNSNAELTEAYDRCVQTLTDLRSYHVNLVTKYIVLEAHKERKEKGYEGHLETRGTGGSDLLGFLKNVRDTTKASKIE